MFRVQKWNTQLEEGVGERTVYTSPTGLPTSYGEHGRSWQKPGHGGHGTRDAVFQQCNKVSGRIYNDVIYLPVLLWKSL